MFTKKLPTAQQQYTHLPSDLIVFGFGLSWLPAVLLDGVQRYTLVMVLVPFGLEGFTMFHHLSYINSLPFCGHLLPPLSEA